MKIAKIESDYSPSKLSLIQTADACVLRERRYCMKCKTCEVMKRIEASNEPACCVWFMDNVVCGDKSVEDCEVYEPSKEKNDG